MAANYHGYDQAQNIKLTCYVLELGNNATDDYHATKRKITTMAQATLQQRADLLVEKEVYCHVGGLVEMIQEMANKSSDFEWESYAFMCEPTDEQIKEYIEENTTDQYTPDEDDARSELQFVEVLEYWAVSEWLAEKLKENGEAVVEFGLTNVWGRTTSGQAISIDYVIEKIVEQTEYAKNYEV